MIGSSGLRLLSTRVVLFNFWARHVGLAEVVEWWWGEGGREPVDSMSSMVRLGK